MELTTTIESSDAGDAAPGDGAGSCAARDMEGIRSDGDAPGATRARGGSARPSQAGGAAGPAAGSAACGDGAAGAVSVPGAGAAGGGVEHDAGEAPDATVGLQQARALEAEDRIRRGRVEHAGRGASVRAHPCEQPLQARYLQAAGLDAEGPSEALEVAPEDVRPP